MDAETRDKFKSLNLRMAEDDRFKDLMLSLLEHDEKYKANIEKIKNFINEGSTFKDAFLKLSQPKDEISSNDLEEIIEAVIKTEAVMPDEELKKKIFSLWIKEFKKGK